MKSLVLTVLALSAPALALADAPRHRITWLIGHENTDYFHDAAYAFRRAVEKGTDGRITVDIQPNASKWESEGRGVPGSEIAQAVARGDAEMGHSFTNVMGAMDRRLWVFDMPFLFRDYAHLEGVFEGPLGDELLAGLGDHGLVGLAFTYSGGANIISTRDREIRGPEDLKGLRVAAFGNTVETRWLESLGAKAVSADNREDKVLSLARRDEIDGAIMTWRRHQRGLGHDGSFKYGSIEGASYLASVTYVNKKFFESLSPEDRKVLMDAARDAGRIERSLTIDLNEQSKRRLMSKWGLRAAPLTAESRASFEKALAPAYGSLAKLVGSELVRRIRETRGDDAMLGPAVGKR